MSIVPFSFELAQDLYNSAKQYPVDFEIGWQWLGYSRKDSAKKKLTSHFIEGEDYQLHQTAELTPSGGLSNREDIRLTANCFKEMGMMAGTEQGKLIRKYFLECERIAKESVTSTKALSPLEILQQQVANLAAIVEVSLEHERKIAELEQQNQELKHQLEAVDMETAANTVELQRFKNGHGFWYSIAGWCSKHGIKKPIQWMNTQGRKASALCKTKGLQPVPVNDPRFGTVGTYPDSVLAELNWD